MKRLGLLGLSIFMFLLFCVVRSADSDVECSACDVLVDELVYIISETNQDEMYKVGYRIGKDGSFGKKRSYFLSEAHIYNILDTVCDAMADYGMLNESPNRKFVRISPRKRDTGKPFTVNGNFKYAEDITKQLTFTCHALVEHNEELLFKLIKEGQVASFCDRVEACKDYEEEAPDDAYQHDEL